MRYQPDHKLEEAIKLIENLDDSENNKLIKYYITHLKNWITIQDVKLQNYSDFFTQLNSYLPNNNPILG